MEREKMEKLTYRSNQDEDTDFTSIFLIALGASTTVIGIFLLGNVLLGLD